MSMNYVRKVVSGGKARFVDQEAAVDLDLVYGKLSPSKLVIHPFSVIALLILCLPVTDRIIMWVHRVVSLGACPER